RARQKRTMHRSLFEPDGIAFPEPEQIVPHALAFVRMMFAHAAFEGRVGDLQDAITKEPGFGEQRKNQWKAHERAEKMVNLIEEKLGKGLPETTQMATILKSAVTPSNARNFLAHGTWWHFDPTTSKITVRGGSRPSDHDEPWPPQREYTPGDI